MQILNNPAQLKEVRLVMWIDQIIKNLNELESRLDSQDINYVQFRKDVQEQFRLLSVTKQVIKGDMKLDGWKLV